MDVAPDTALGDLALALGVVDLLVGDRDVLSSDVVLVGSLHVVVEYLHGDGNETRVSDPSSIVTSFDFSLLVVSDLVHSGLVGDGVVLDGDQGGHSAHGGDFSSAR